MDFTSSRAPSRTPQVVRRRRLALAGVSLLVAVVVLVLLLSGGSQPPLPLPGIGQRPHGGDPFAYDAARAQDFVARASAGEAHVLFTKSPDGALATAARVAPFRGLIDTVTAGTGIDPNALEGIVFLESAGYPDAIAGSDPANAAGLTQIVAETGTGLLGMRIDLVKSRRLTAKIDAADAHGDSATVARMEAARARIDDRFDPRKALAATVRYLELARRRFGRGDLALESYHMGIGNLQSVLDLYDGGAPVPYVQLYFDTAPDRHAAAFRLLSSFGDDSWTYYWRVLAAEQIMRLYRTDRRRLEREASLQTATDSAALALHPPDRAAAFADPDALDSAYAARQVLPLPRNARALGLLYDPGMGSLAHRLGVTPALYRGLRPQALDLMVELAARIKALSGAAPLIVTSTVLDGRYQRLLGESDPPAAGGWSFTIARRYVDNSQAYAFQAMLDRLQALNLIAWQRYAQEIEVTVAADADRVLAAGP